MTNSTTKLVFAASLLLCLAGCQLFYCDVPNCEACSYYNTCGVCQNNHAITLASNGAATCSPIPCLIENCLTCYADSLCQVCIEGLFPQPDGSCTGADMTINCTDNCLACSLDGSCGRCSAGYSLQLGQCLPNIPLIANCKIGLNTGMCKLCNPDFYLNSAFQCQPYTAEPSCLIQNCFACSENDVCSQCGSGLIFTNSSCIEDPDCSVENCESCNADGMCETCMNTYYLVNQTCMVKTYSCADSNCVQCVEGPLTCGACAAGFYLQQFSSDSLTAITCMQVTENMVSSPVAVPNCLTFGLVSPETPSILTYGCISCSTGFYLVGGVCVAMLIPAEDIACNVDNCLQCVLPNYCNTCSQGYFIPYDAGGICVKKFSMIPYCAWSADGSICLECLTNYALSQGMCYPVDPQVSCAIAGCEFCIEDNLCEQCQVGFSSVQDNGVVTCEADCAVDNCLQCSGNSTCSLCEYGWQVDETNIACVLYADSGKACPQETYGAGCQVCNNEECVSCVAGNVFDPVKQVCCSSETLPNCLEPLSACSSQCGNCQIGYRLEFGRCSPLPCNLPNCAYCFRSTTCLACKEGYTYDASADACLAYTIPTGCNGFNCIECESDGTCLSCVNGYVINEGVCVCDFQNCLDCIGDAFCSGCVYPSIPVLGGGCIPPYSMDLLCQVENCAECFGLGQCSLCAVGYTLSNAGVCVLNGCSDAECLLCDSSNTFCYACSAGFMPDNLFGKNCVEIPADYSCEVAGCAVCSSPTECQICDEQYALVSDLTCGKIPCNVRNCMFCTFADSCLSCYPGFFYEQASLTCQPVSEGVPNLCTTVDNCLVCAFSDNQCQVCNLGFTVSDSLTCEPQQCNSQLEPSCAICSDIKMQGESLVSGPQYCQLCQQGYFRNSYLECVQYSPNIPAQCDSSIYNCLYCATAQSCSLCLEGWMVKDTICLTENFCSVDNCLYCSTPALCHTCDPQYQLSSPSSCVPECSVEYCLECATTPNICSQCMDTFQYVESDNMCQCQAGFTLVQADNMCYECSIDFCQLCTQTNSCSTCLDDLLPNEAKSACECPPTYERVNGTLCECPAQTTENNNTCYQCDIANCVDCESDGVCSTCASSFELNSEANTCVCPDNSILSSDDNICYQCAIDYCHHCSSDGVCAHCLFNLVIDNNVCVCPPGFELASDGQGCVCPLDSYESEGECFSCASVLSNCAQCSTPQLCDKCILPFQFQQTDGACICPESYVSQGDDCSCPQNFTDFEGVCYNCTEPTNCLSCSDTNICQQCANNLEVTNNNTCSCSQPFILSPDQTSCVCPANSTANLEDSTCILCEIEFCTLCNTENVCSACSGTFVPSSDQTSCECPPTFIQSGETCVCPSGFYQNSDNVCQQCQIQYCQQCQSADLCAACLDSFILAEANSTCACPDSTYDIVDGPLCQCPPSYLEHAGSCYLCQIDYCTYCSADNVCGLCFDDTFSLSADGSACGCSLQVLDGSTCGCPDNTVEFNATCVGCAIDYCSSCQVNQVCAQCDSGFSKVNNQCICPSTFVITASALCECPSGTFNVSNQCQSCGIANCLTCQSASTCSHCLSSFTLKSPTLCSCPNSSYKVINGTCQCPANTTLASSGMCEACAIPSCQLCESNNTCSQCLPNFTPGDNSCTCKTPFVLSQSQCVCPSNTTLFEGQCVQCAINGCYQCQQSNICATCAATYVKSSPTSCVCPSSFTEFQQTCYNCTDAPYCSVCSGANFCAQCMDPSFNISAEGVCYCVESESTLFNGVCVACAIPSCHLCESADICSTCLEGYTLSVEDNYCILCGISNCDSCYIENMCEECSAGLQVSSDASACVVCDIENCLSCSKDNICATCDSSNNVQVSSSGTTCVLCNEVNACSQCSANNVCARCQLGYVLNLGANTCDLCEYPCTSCVTGSSSKCLACAKPYSSAPNSAGQCFTCAVPNCLSCSSQTPTVCTACASGYRLVSGACQLTCVSNLCMSCSDPSICAKCTNEFVPNGNSCKPCLNSPQCLNCSPTNTSQCLTCNTGYFLVAATASCQACAPNCQTCFTNTTCLTYKASTAQFGLRVGNQTLPAICDPGCKACSALNPTQCITCESGFALQSSSATCAPCSSPCKTCSPTNSSQCLSCYGNAYLSSTSNTCLMCTSASNCLTCNQTNLAQCLTCPYGYNMADNNTCAKGCPNNCLACSSASVCSLCISGYSPNSNGTCLPCLSSCRECSSQANGVCLSCGSGFYLNTAGSCTVCAASFCSSCNVNGCNTCLPGYTLTPTFTCAKNCKAPCATCSQNSSTLCTSCLAGYTFDSTTSTCVGVITCEGGCNVCPFQYALSADKQCLQCGGSCSRCLASSLTTCTSCMDGMYLSSDSSCASCPSGCDTCSSPDNCLSCQSGYTQLVESVTTSMSCIQCSQPCLQCMGNAQTCTACQPGYTLSGWKCQSDFHFQLTITLSVDPPVFYSNYQLFLNQLATAIGSSNFNVVNMMAIRQGSTIVDATLNTQAPTGSLEATNQFDSLTNSLSVGTSIGGMQVQQVQANVVGGSIAQVSSGPNLGLILGISIPLAVILIGVIVFCACRQRSLPYSDSSDTNRQIRQEFQLTNTAGIADI